MSYPVFEDIKIRVAAFKWLEEKVHIHGDVLPISILREGFLYEGHRVPLIGPKGIFKPRIIKDVPLSITTAPKRPYDDFIGDDGLIRYKYRGSNPNHPDNVGLRQAIKLGVPLVYFHGISPGKYLAIWPVFVIGDDPESLTFLISADRQSRYKIRSFILKSDSGYISSKHKRDFVSFPVVDLSEILVIWDKCLKVIIGPISDEIIKEMIDKNFDYVPVLSSDSPNAAVLGLISRTRLEVLYKERKYLDKNDTEILDISNVEIPVRSNLDNVLRLLSSQPTRIVTREGEANNQTDFCIYGLINRSDLNKPPIRKIIYEILARLEISLANYIVMQNMDPYILIQGLKEESQARILGYWELSKRKNVDTGPLTGAMLPELINIVAKNKHLYTELGFKSRSEFEENTELFADIRNQVMHPVRPLITDRDSCLHLEQALTKAIDIIQKLHLKI